jgi:hypothetical protein
LIRKLPLLKKYERSLKAFSSETEFKDEIVKFNLEKLDPEDKDGLLPYIIRILNAKLLKKRGKAGVKTIETKRTIVYRFLASLSVPDLGVFIDQVIEPFGLSREDALNPNLVEQTLARCSFGQYLAFMSALESIVKQMGSLVQDYLPILCNIVVAIFKLSRKFYNAIKEAEGDVDNIDEIEEESDNDEDEQENEENQVEVSSDPLKKNTLKSCRAVLSQTFKRINGIFEKYFYNSHIKEEFSEGVLEIYSENILNLHLQNITSKSSLLETFETWSRHLNLHSMFLKSPVIEQLCKILSIEKDIVHFEVYTVILSILKNLVLSSLSTSDPEIVDRRDAVIMSFLQNGEGEVDEEMQDGNNADSVEIVKSKYGMVIRAISDFLGFNWELIKNGVLKQKEPQLANLDKTEKTMAKNNLTKTQVFRSPSFIKTIVLILSELSIYVNIDQKSDLEKLTDMFIPLLTVKGFVMTGKEDLVNYTLKTVERLCNKMPSLLTTKRYYLISKLLSENIKLSTRNHLCSLLTIIPDSKIKRTVNYLKNMNKIKKGLATATLDFDKAIDASTQFQEKFLAKSKYPEIVPILFQMIHFVHNSELALRSAAVSLIDAFLQKYEEDTELIITGNSSSEELIQDIKDRSNFIIYHLIPSLRSVLNMNVDELILKSSFKLFKKYLVVISNLHTLPSSSDHLKTLQTPSDFLDLACVITPKDEYTDFFENILNIKLQRRYKAIRSLCAKIDSGEIHALATLTKFLLPIADMFIIRMSQAQSATRGVISYTKQNFEQINTE